MRSLLFGLLLALPLAACSGGSGGDGYGSSPSPTPPPPSGDPAWDKVAAVVAADCAGCHNGTKEPLLTPKATFLASPVRAKVSSGAMPPPPKTINDADKQVLLNYASP